MNTSDELQPDQNGIFWSYRLDGDGGGTIIDPESALRHEADHGFSWIHLRSDLSEAELWMSRHHIDVGVIEALTAVETRPKAMPLAHGMLIVLRAVNHNPGADPDDMVSIRLWIKDNIVISARKRDRMLRSVRDVRDSIATHTAPRSVSEFVANLVERIAGRIGEVVDAIDDELTEYEVDQAAIPIPLMRRKLSECRRQAASIRRYLSPQRDALDSLFRSQAVLTEHDAHILREQTDRMMRYVEEMDLARERTLVLQEELQNRIAEVQNSRVYVLSLVAAIFLPLSYLTGVFGMNVAGLPGTENPLGFIYVALGMVALALASIAFLRWTKWL